MDIERLPAGFWIRFCAGLVDLVVVVVPVILVAEVAANFGLYVPVEIVALAAYAAYTAAGIGWKGTTLGKVALGIRVERRDGRTVRWVRASMRAILVFVSQCLLGLPLLIIGARQTKRGWHDSLCGTTVVLQNGLERRRWLVASVVLVFVFGSIGVSAFESIRLCTVRRRWIADADAAADKGIAASGDPVEVSSVMPEDRVLMQAWLAEHGRSPSELVVDVAARHQVTLVGEVHGRRQYLEFFKSIIPDLYNRARIRVIALEYCHPDQNKELAELVNSENFDPEKLQRIAREAIWQAWGYRQYWEVLHVVWQVNRRRPDGQEPLRVIGISPRLDGASFTLVKSGPLHERLRIVRILDELPDIVFHDAYYARRVEREAFDRGERTLVWVGAAHAVLRPSPIAGTDGRGVRRSHRMGSMLAGRYGDAVGQVILHNEFQHGGVAKLIEESADKSGNLTIAFAAEDSPFAALRDGEALGYRWRPRQRFADSVCNYVLLVPLDALEDCDWMDGFLSQRMLGRNRPYYELLAGRRINNPEETDQYMGKALQQL